MRCTFQHYLPWAIPPSRGGTIGNVGASDPTVFPKEKRFNSVQPVCELLPQALSLHVVDVRIAVGGVNDLGTGINKGINLFAFQSLYSSLNRLVTHVITELRDIHAERTVLDGGDSGGIAVKAAHDGIGIRLLSINAEKLHFSQSKVQLSWRRQRDLKSKVFIFCIFFCVIASYSVHHPVF